MTSAQETINWMQQNQRNIYSHLKGEIHNVEENLKTENILQNDKEILKKQWKHMNPSTPPLQKKQKNIQK